MKQHKFHSHDEYIETQRALTRQKIRRSKLLCSTGIEEMQAIYDHHRHLDPVLNGLCHGVRKGQELDLFEDVFGGGDWIGTEISEQLCDGKRIICQDFSYLPDEWIGKFDLVYSNTLDHARYPLETIKTWLLSVSSVGRLYIEWTRYDDRLRRNNRADCFAANEQEYEEMISKIGLIEKIIKLQLPDDLFTRTVFVIKKADYETK